jgi:DNA-binding CsgD family transcriptional regulator
MGNSAQRHALERFRRRDLVALLDIVADVGDAERSDEYARRVLAALPRIVGAESIGYTEVDPYGRNVATIVDPEDLRFPGDVDIFARHVHEHPLIMHYERSGDGRARTMSDFLTQRELHRLALYREYYRRAGVEYQIAITLPATRPTVVGITLGRSVGDFGDRDRAMLDAARPHLANVYRHLRARERLTAALQAIGDAGGDGVLVLGRHGSVELASDEARALVARYFGRDTIPPLPEELTAWLRRARADAPPPRPLVRHRGPGTLVVRLFARRGPAGDDVLLLDERRATAGEVEAFRVASLSARENEVLGWVAVGKTNGEIAAILGLSPRTIQRHLERIYDKLGVSTRTAAVASARALSRPAPRG